MSIHCLQMSFGIFQFPLGWALPAGHMCDMPAEETCFFPPSDTRQSFRQARSVEVCPWDLVAWCSRFAFGLCSDVAAVCNSPMQPTAAATSAVAFTVMFMKLACVVICTVICVRIPSKSYSLLFLLLEIWVLHIWAVWIMMLWIFFYMVGFSGVHLNAFLLNT